MINLVIRKLQKDSGHSQPLPYSPSWVVFRPNVLVDARTGGILSFSILCLFVCFFPTQCLGGCSHRCHLSLFHTFSPVQTHISRCPCWLECLHTRNPPLEIWTIEHEGHMWRLVLRLEATQGDPLTTAKLLLHRWEVWKVCFQKSASKRRSMC